MKRITLAVALALGSMSALADTAVAKSVYANEVVSATVGTGPRLAGRTDATAALGDNSDDAFYSLGRGGELVLSFGTLVGGIGKITEVTWNTTNYIETAQLYTSLDGKSWSVLTTVLNAFAVDGYSIYAGSPFRYLKIIDTSPSGWARDGFDVASVEFTAVAPVPVPAAAALMLGGLGGLAGLKLRRRKRA